MMLHFHGSSLYALCLLSIITAQLHSNYSGGSLHFELFLPFVRRLGVFFFSFLITGLCLQYEMFLNEDL